MKTKSLITFVIVSFIAVTTFATDAPKMNIIPVDSNKAIITFQTKTPSKLEITLKDNDGAIFYYKKSDIPTDAYRDLIDISALPKGLYTMCVIAGNKSIQRELQVSKKDIKIGSALCLYEPYFCIHEGILDVSFFNIARKKVQLDIFKNGEFVSGTNLGKEMAVQRRLDISNFEKGKYELVLTDWFKKHKVVVQI